MDAIGACIAQLHDLLGHAKAAAVLGVDPGDVERCLLCAYENGPTPERRRAVEEALSANSLTPDTPKGPTA